MSHIVESWQNWMAAYLGYTLRMNMLFCGWPIMVNDAHTRRRRLATKFNLTQSTLLKLDRVALALYTLAAKLTLSAAKLNVTATKSTATSWRIYFVAYLFPKSAAYLNNEHIRQQSTLLLVLATADVQQSQLWWIELCRLTGGMWTCQCVAGLRRLNCDCCVQCV